mgnify:CR=1 FL=1
MKRNIIYDYQIFLKQKYGGPSKYFVELNKNINKKNFSNKIVAPFHVNRHLRDSEFNRGNFFFYKKFNLNNFLSKYNQYNTLKLLKNLHNPIIHSTYYNLKYLRDIKCKKIVTVYDLIHEKLYPEKKLNDDDNKKNAIMDADFFICISKNTQKDLIEIYNVEPQKTKVIYLSSSLPKKEIKVKKNKDYLLFVGNRSGYKNSEFILRALAKYEKFKKNFDLYFFGGPKFTKDEINMLNDIEIFNNTKHLGNDEKKLKSLYKNALCLIYPSLYEGFGIPLLEAMECGCPILCCNTPALKEIGQDAVEYFQQNNEDSFIESLEKIIYSKDLINKIKKSGFQRRSHFSWEKCAEETEQIYKNL